MTQNKPTTVKQIDYKLSDNLTLRGYVAADEVDDRFEGDIKKVYFSNLSIADSLGEHREAFRRVLNGGEVRLLPADEPPHTAEIVKSGKANGKVMNVWDVDEFGLILLHYTQRGNANAAALLHASATTALTLTFNELAGNTIAAASPAKAMSRIYTVTEQKMLNYDLGDLDKTGLLDFCGSMTSSYPQDKLARDLCKVRREQLEREKKRIAKMAKLQDNPKTRDTRFVEWAACADELRSQHRLPENTPLNQYDAVGDTKLAMAFRKEILYPILKSIQQIDSYPDEADGKVGLGLSLNVPFEDFNAEWLGKMRMAVGLNLSLFLVEEELATPVTATIISHEFILDTDDIAAVNAWVKDYRKNPNIAPISAAVYKDKRRDEIERFRIHSLNKLTHKLQQRNRDLPPELQVKAKTRKK